MMSSCTSQRWTMVAALFVLLSQILLPGRPAAAAATAEALLAPTPLVLKDGRIANVSIHILPFVGGEAELAGDTARRLADLTASVATDCFLTAQIIGHVSSDEVADNDTLAAHRLARSRADKVQASLIDGGLPAKAIASVWDWQFLVREPRATLWMFRLIQGEDCDGEPLDGAGAQLVATNDGADAAGAPTRRAAAAPDASASTDRRASPDPQPETEDEAASAAQSLPMVSSAMAAEAPAARTEAPDTSREAEASRHETAPAGPAKQRVPVVTKELPALSPTQDTDQPASLASPSPRSTQGTAHSGERDMAAVQPARPSPAESARAGAAAEAQQSAKRPDEQDPERRGRVEQGADGGVIITFATNSSYFPPGTSRRLRSLIDEMSSDGRYRVQLEVGVSGSDTVIGASSPEEARRYNKWLAERRATRVQEWLSENAQDKQLEVESAFVADDSSRRVVVRVVPSS